MVEEWLRELGPSLREQVRNKCGRIYYQVQSKFTHPGKCKLVIENVPEWVLKADVHWNTLMWFCLRPFITNVTVGKNIEIEISGWNNCVAYGDEVKSELLNVYNKLALDRKQCLSIRDTYEKRAYERVWDCIVSSVANLSNGRCVLVAEVPYFVAKSIPWTSIDSMMARQGCLVQSFKDYYLRYLRYDRRGALFAFYEMRNANTRDVRANNRQ